MSDVVVLLGTRLAALEEHGTRWRALLVRWARDPRVSSLTVVDYPTFGRGLGAREVPSWLDGCRALDLRVPGRVGQPVGAALAWRLAGRAVARQLPASADRVVVAATPLSAPLLAVLPADRRAFDAVDDWRELPSMAAARRRVEQGYRSARRADVVTAVSPVLSRRLADDYGLAATTVPNGVDAPTGSGPVPAGLPAGPFAVYVGSLQQRVDLDLVAATARRVPVVLAGRATPECAARLADLPVHWLGPVPVGAVPGLLRAASAGLVPHHRDRLTESMAPMKALEYAAAGLPVVSTSVRGLDGVPRLTVADDAEAFARAAAEAVAEGRQQPPAGWVDDRSWDRVSDRLLALVTGRPA